MFSSNGVKATNLSIFVYNSSSAVLYFYLGGLSFGILSTITVVKLGIMNGVWFFKYPLLSIFYLLPHAIFEVTGYLIATAAGYKLLITAINIVKQMFSIKRESSIIEQFNGVLDDNYFDFRDTLVLFLFAIILLIIASIIEANITVPLAKYMLTILNYKY